MILIDKLKQLIDEHEVISFDIFDVLLLRPYVCPTDLFGHIEYHYSQPHFQENRINAELAARNNLKNGIHEITLDEIYEQIPEQFKYLKS